MAAPTPYFNTWGVNNNSYNQLINYIKEICANHGMKPSCTFGPIWDFNADNQIFFPSIWIEPIDTKIVNSIQGVRVLKYAFYVYAVDRVDKGDNNFQDVMSDMDFLIKTIVAEIREGEFSRLNYFIIDSQDDEMHPVIEFTDEYTAGWRCKLMLRIPDIYNPCNVPIIPVPEPCTVTYVQPGYVVCGYVQ